MIDFLILIFVIIALCSLTEERWGTYKGYVYIAIILGLIIIAGLREVGVDNDSINYEYTYRHYDQDTVLKEITYTFLAWLYNFITYDVYLLFITYAILGVTTKARAFKQIMPDIWFLPMLVYFSNYFILHEMTQIRAGVASGFFLLSIRHIANGEKRAAALRLLCATLFHYSAIVLFPLLLFNNRPLKNWHKYLLYAVVPVSYLMYFMHIEITSIPIPYISEKMDAYQQMRDKGLLGDSINVFNATFLLKIAVYYFILLMYDTIYAYNKYLPILLRIMALSIFSFLFLSPLPVMAFRVMELYGVVDIFLYSFIVYTIKQTTLAKFIIVIICAAILSLNLFYVELIHDV